MIGFFDVETKSEAGFYFDAGLGRFVPIPETTKGSKPGLPTIGTAAYAEHPTTDLVCMSYFIGHWNFWTPDLPDPVDLFKWITDGNELEAVNSFFEFNIWLNCGHKKRGWPYLPIEQTRDTAAKARAYGLPGKLKLMGEALELDDLNLKDAAGDRLIKKFTIPRRPTKKDPRHWIDIHDEPLDGGLFYAYCEQDVKSEMAASARIPELSADELEVWKVDQKINERGVYIDAAALEACLDIVGQAEAKYNAELADLTRGKVKSHGELAKLGNWLAQNGLVMPNMQKDTIDEYVKFDDIPPICRRALEIRSSLNSASVKKLKAIKRTLSADGRLRGLYMYSGATRTQRWTGNGPQPQNLKRDGSASVDDWNLDAIEAALEAVSCGSLEYLDIVYGDPLATIGGCVRGLFVSAPGHDLICSDYSAIEAVVLAALAGEQWRLDVFRRGEDIYKASASLITGVPVAEVDTKLRKMGKVAELGCLGADTLVLTKNGYKEIVKITEDDWLWDGRQWVQSDGAVNKGIKTVINLDGLTITPDHKVSCGVFWTAAERLASNQNTLDLARAIASVSLSSLGQTVTEKSTAPKLSVLVAAARTLSRFQTFTSEKRRDAENVPTKRRVVRGLENTRIVPTLCLKPSIVRDWSIDCVRRLGGVINRKTRDIKTMAPEVLPFAMPGAPKRALGHFWNTYKPLTVGINRIWKWTGLTTTEVTNRVISGLSLARKINQIAGLSSSYKNASTSSNVVYDILNCGSLNRFTVKTDSGHLLVHNSGYGGWINAWKNFGADAYYDFDDDIKRDILAWRAASPAIVEFWGDQYRRVHQDRWDFVPELYGVEGAIVKAIQNPMSQYWVKHVAFCYDSIVDVLYCRLPSGRALYYHKPKLTPTEHRLAHLPAYAITYMGYSTDKGWIRKELWGSKAVENITQAVARDRFAYAMVQFERRGYPLVMHSHDEGIAEVAEGFGSVAEFELIMSANPNWCANWPIKAAGGWRGKRYFKS